MTSAFFLFFYLLTYLRAYLLTYLLSEALQTDFAAIALAAIGTLHAALHCHVQYRPSPALQQNLK